MTNPHPLTDKMCGDIAENLPDYNAETCMRAAADWQLEQVKKIVESKIKDMYRRGYKGMCVDLVYRADAIEEFFEDIMQEIHPEENN